MATTLEQVAAILRGAEIKFHPDEERGMLRTAWKKDEVPVTLLILLYEDGELLQLRVPGLLTATDETKKPLLFRAMLQMAYEIRLVQFEYDPSDGEVSTCIDIALEDAVLTAEQLLRCCSLLLDVSFIARDRLVTILDTGRDPALESSDVDREEAEQRQSQLDAMMELARLMKNTRGDA